MASRNLFVLSPVAVLVVLLTALAAFIVYLKVSLLHMPLEPGESSDVWTVEARIDFTAPNGATRVNFRLPDETPGFTFLDESFVSRGFGLNITEDPREAVWTVRRGGGDPLALFYRVQVYPENENAASAPDRRGEPVTEAPFYPEPLASAIDAVLMRARAESADIFTFANRLMAILTETSDENVKVIRDARPAAQWPQLLTEILAGARITSRVVYGISLSDDFIERPLITWIEVNNGQSWRGFDPDTGTMGYPPNFFPWMRGLQTILQSNDEVRDLRVNFSAQRQSIAQEQLAQQVENTLLSGLMNFTLYSLPIPSQEVYKVLLMVPLGALVIAFMRVVVGVPTFGTFTPILIALAFRETQLGWGVTLFMLILGAGFLCRVALANLRLLLVPRLACMLIIVIGLMVVMSLLSQRLGFTQGLSIALFPMVILTMTIERMSIVWEERGSVETVKETIGSLVVAISGYYVMNHPLLMHLMFNYPELLLVVLAVCMLFGSYTGYRVSEVLRFKDLARDKGDKGGSEGTA
ncbi:MAG: inactive transglutaminase family protein [Pseudomonadota bacterium]|nr:inactive transglutaminase family protein [Pseudomonadota bacterium]